MENHKIATVTKSGRETKQTYINYKFSNRKTRSSKMVVTERDGDSSQINNGSLSGADQVNIQTLMKDMEQLRALLEKKG